MAAAWDVLVVGAGPAGAAAALTLARGGARTVVLERARVPRYKTCGGGLVARALELLPARVPIAPERRLAAVELNVLDAGSSFRVSREGPIVSTAMRADFDAALLDAAVQAGAEVHDACTVRELVEEPGGVTVRTGHGTFSARCVIGADGVNGVVARQAGWPGAPRSIPALEGELRVDSDTLERFGAALRFDFGVPADGYGWVFPKRAHLSVGVLRMRQRGRARGGLKRLLATYLERVGLGAYDCLELHGSAIPVAPRPGGVARGRVMLVGDAAGVADPITAEGISHAILSGQLAGDALLAGAGDIGRAVRAYRLGLEREILAELRAARPLARMLYGLPALRRAMFRRSGHALCEVLTDVVSGRRSYRELLRRPRSYLRLLRRERAA